MIIKTKTHKFAPHAKLILAIIAVTILPFILGWIVGSAQTMSKIVSIATHFVSLDGLLDENKIRAAISAYEKSQGQGWLFDNRSPLYINDSLMSVSPYSNNRCNFP